MFAYFFPDTFVFLVESRGLGKEFPERDKIIICNFDKWGKVQVFGDTQIYVSIKMI